MRYSQHTVTNVCITPEPPDSTLAGAVLDRYFGELAARFPGGSAEFDPARIAAPTTEFTPPDGVLLLARLDGQAVGCGAVRTLDAEHAEIKRMWVDPTVGGRGIGRSRLAALESAAAELGCHTVRLDTAHWLEKPLR